MSKRKSRDDFLDDERVDCRLIRDLCSDTRVLQYEGKTGEERLKRAVDADGSITHYEGERGVEYLVKAEVFSLTSGFRRLCHYVGEKGAEVLVRVQHSNGNVTHYTGKRGKEYKQYVIFPSGNVLHFRGRKGAECKARQVDADGTVTAFMGEQGQERLSCTLSLDGEYTQFNGSKGNEWPCLVVDSNGLTTQYEVKFGDTVCVRSFFCNEGTVHNTFPRPLDTIHMGRDALNNSIDDALTGAEKLQKDGHCNENGWLVIGHLLNKIHNDAKRLGNAAEAACTKELHTVSQTVPTVYL